MKSTLCKKTQEKKNKKEKNNTGKETFKQCRAVAVDSHFTEQTITTKDLQAVDSGGEPILLLPTKPYRLERLENHMNS